MHSLFLMFHSCSLTTKRNKPFTLPRCGMESLILSVLKILYSFSLREQFLFHFNSFIEQKSVRYIKRVYIFQNISFVKCLQSFLWESRKDRCTLHVWHSVAILDPSCQSLIDTLISDSHGKGMKFLCTPWICVFSHHLPDS